MTRWYVVHTQPKGEKLACDNLVRQGFPVFLPQYMRRRHHARKIDFVRSPLFPRYLFVAIDLERAPWRAIASTVGVSHLVCRGDRPAAVPDGIVEGIQARADSHGLVSLASPIPYRYGEAVNVIDGIFADQTGFFECVVDADRVVLLLNLLGRQVRVKVPLESVAHVA